MPQRNYKLYFVDVNKDKNLLLALDIQFIEEVGKTVVGFFDTNRGRIFKGEIVMEDNLGFMFQTENNDASCNGKTI